MKREGEDKFENELRIGSEINPSPDVIKVFGEKVSEEIKAKIKEEQENRLFYHRANLPKLRFYEELSRFEYQKSNEENLIISFANEETNKLMEEIGVAPVNISPDNVHIISSEAYQNFGGGIGFAKTDFMMEGIIVDAKVRSISPVVFALAVMHEILHLKGKQVFQLGKISKDGEEMIFKTMLREGISVSASQKSILEGKKHIHFVGLEEAIVESQVKKLMPKILALEIFRNYRQWLLSPEGEMAQKEAERRAESLSIPQGEISWLEKEGREWTAFAYLAQRQVLAYVCEEIQKQFPDKYKSADEVFREFLKAHFTGRLLVVGRLVEETFGKGSFRLLGSMGIDQNNALLCLEALQKSRRKVLSNSI